MELQSKTKKFCWRYVLKERFTKLFRDKVLDRVKCRVLCPFGRLHISLHSYGRTPWYHLPHTETLRSSLTARYWTVVLKLLWPMYPFHRTSKCLPPVSVNLSCSKDTFQIICISYSSFRFSQSAAPIHPPSPTIKFLRRGIHHWLRTSYTGHAQSVEMTQKIVQNHHTITAETAADEKIKPKPVY